MGNSASKAASNATKSAINSATKSSTRAQQTTPGAPPESAPRNINIRGDSVTPASESKSEAILKDASDPSFPTKGLLSQNLASLGQVNTKAAQRHNENRFTPDTSSARVLQRRAELEESEAMVSTPKLRNIVTAGSLTTLLDARKEVKSPQELRRLCADFNCDPDKIEQLGKYITSPSVSLIRSKQQEKEDTYLARWVDPAQLHEQIQSN